MLKDSCQLAILFVVIAIAIGALETETAVDYILTQIKKRNLKIFSQRFIMYT